MRTALLSLALLGCLVLCPRDAHAQTRRFAVDARAGSGLSIAGAGGQTLLARTPIFAEAGMHTWLNTEANIVLGGSVRVEVEGRASVGGVFRAGLRVGSEPVELRPSIGIAMIFAPYTLVGPEASAMIVFHIVEPVRFITQFALDAFLFGTDLPSGSALLFVNGTAGIEVGL